MLLPIGVGAAQNLFSAIAGDWHASANTVALATGILSGVISMVGCVAGGGVADKMDRKTAYCLFALVLAVAAAGMAVLESIGTGAAATTYNVLAGISNFPIAYQTVTDGRGHDLWGSNGLLYVDALCGVIAVAVYFSVAFSTRRLLPRFV